MLILNHRTIVGVGTQHTQVFLLHTQNIHIICCEIFSRCWSCWRSFKPALSISTSRVWWKLHLQYVLKIRTVKVCQTKNYTKTRSFSDGCKYQIHCFTFLLLITIHYLDNLYDTLLILYYFCTKELVFEVSIIQTFWCFSTGPQIIEAISKYFYLLINHRSLWFYLVVGCNFVNFICLKVKQFYPSFPWIGMNGKLEIDNE